MPADIDIEIKGIEEVSRKMDQVAKDLTGPEMVQGMRDATLIVTRDARIFSPVDTGRLRASIAPEVKTRGKIVEGIVGSNVVYAPYQEMGTARFEGKRFLERAFTENLDRIKAIIGDVVGSIVRR